jgi:Mrp family chromosome partitioning ATPase
MNDPLSESSIDVVVGAIRRHWLVALACLIIVPGVAYVLSSREQKQYSATAALLFGIPSDATQVLEISSASGGGGAAESTTNAQLVSLAIIGRRTEAVLAHRLGSRYRPATISVSAGSQSDIATITATSTDPGIAAITANAYAEEYISMRKRAEQQRLRSAQRTLGAELAALPPGGRSTKLAQKLRTAQQNLGTLAALQTGGAELVQPAGIPASPNSSNRARNVTLGGLLGVVLALTAALILDKLDRRVRDPQDIHALLPWTVFGGVPYSRGLRRRPGELELSGAIADSLRTIRSNLRYTGASRSASALAVASVDRGAGASTLAYQLAAVSSRLGSKVLFVEADLRKSSVAARRGLAASGDLAQVLAGHAVLSDAVLRVPLVSSEDGRPVPTFDLLPAPAEPPGNAVELLESERLEDLVRTAKREYDLVIFDVTTPRGATDAYPVMHAVDGTILVVRLQHTTRLAAAELRPRLEDLGTRVLGVIINRSNPGGITARPMSLPERNGIEDGYMPQLDSDAATRARQGIPASSISKATTPT